MKFFTLALTLSIWTAEASGSPFHGEAASSLPAFDEPISSLAKGNSDPSVLCIAFQCGGPLARCKMNRACNDALGCVRSCKSEDPVERQRCQIICAESTASPQYDRLVGCMLDKGCLPKKQPYACATPRNRQALAPVTLKDLDGSWRVIRGLSPAYDCWSCQKMSFARRAPNLSDYRYEYVVRHPRPASIACQVEGIREGDAQEPTPGRFLVTYTAHNVPGKDDWYVLGYTGDYALIYYCGDSAMDSYRGAVVMARAAAGVTDELPDEVKSQFEMALKAADIDLPIGLGDFCTPDNSRCPD